MALTWVKTVLELMTGEWKGTSSRTRKLPCAVVAFILMAVMVLNLVGLL
jgi:hypothetical protein